MSLIKLHSRHSQPQQLLPHKDYGEVQALAPSMTSSDHASRTHQSHVHLLLHLGAVSRNSCLFGAGRFDVPIPPLHPHRQSDHVASILYIADFLTQFCKVLATKPITFQQLCTCLHPGTSPDALLASNPLPTTAGGRSATAAAKLAGSAAVGGASRSQAAAVGGRSGTAGLSNGAVAQHGRGVSNGGCTNGGGAAALGIPDDAKAADGNGALFDVYRGLLQFLLQVNWL